jgi:hypothetical protein
MRTALRSITGVVLLVLGVVGSSRIDAQATNPCRSGGVQMLSKTTYRFAVELPDHNATLPGSTTFAATKYTNRWVVDVAGQDASTQPAVHFVDVPRAQMALVPDSNPACYLSPPVTVGTTVPVWRSLRSYVIAWAGTPPNESPSMSSEATDPFVLGLLRLGAHRVQAVP